MSQFIFSWEKYYFFPILDMHTNKIISYHLALKLNMAQIEYMFKKIFLKFLSISRLIFHLIILT